MSKNYYEILEVSKDASKEESRKNEFFLATYLDALWRLGNV